jgi:threonylcarbamoyladenosine tRNA methylthiotransferase MtaB
MTPRSVAFYTLGCKLNYSETSGLERLFENAGYRALPFEESADVYVINTCSVTDFADQKCRNTVRRAMRKNPHALIIVVGCYAQLKPKEIADIPGVDLVLGAAEKFRILDFIGGLEKSTGKGLVRAGDVREANQFVSSFSFGDRTRSFLKVQDGCNYKCSFCTIPLARGASRSDTVEQVLINTQALADKGAQEIVLTGVNLGDFGNGTEVIEGLKPRKEALFADLVREIDQQHAVARYRISSIEPNLLTDEIIGIVTESSCFMPHFHLPLQSGNARILAQMRRRYTRDLYESRVLAIKRAMPHACIGVDVIVGFPGETDEEFLDTYQFIQSLPVSYLHVFTYSERPNTLAAELPGAVSMQTRKKRNEMLRSLSDQKQSDFYQSFVGQTRPVLFEVGGTESKPMLTGFTDNYIKVELPWQDLMVNTIQPVALSALQNNDTLTVKAELVGVLSL